MVVKVIGVTIVGQVQSQCYHEFEMFLCLVRIMMKSCEKQSKRKKIEFRDFIIQMNLLKSPKVDQLPNLKVTCIKSAFRVLCDIFATLKPEKNLCLCM